MTAAVDVAEALEIGRSGREFFDRHGWWVTPPVLNEPLLEDLAYGIERFYAQDVDWRLPAVPPGDTAHDARAGTRQNDYVSLQVAEVRSFVLDPLIGALLAGVSGHGEIRLFHDQLITKPPGPGAVGWHSDRSYWLTCTSAEMLTVWVPMCDVDETNSPLRVIDGSHRWPIDHATLRGFHDEHARPPSWQDDEPVISLPMQRGQVSLHHAGTVHSSGPNATASPRTALAIHAQPGSNSYQRPPASAPALHFNDVLCRRDAAGNPDYSDPHVCPQMWPYATHADS